MILTSSTVLVYAMEMLTLFREDHALTAEQKAESSSAAASEMADVVLCGAFQGSGKTKNGDSLPSLE